MSPYNTESQLQTPLHRVAHKDCGTPCETDDEGQAREGSANRSTPASTAAFMPPTATHLSPVSASTAPICGSLASLLEASLPTAIDSVALAAASPWMLPLAEPW